MFDFIRGSWRRGRDTAATLRDLEMLARPAARRARRRGLRSGAREALRYTGPARRGPRRGRDRAPRRSSRRATCGSEAGALRLLGHIASDLGQPAQGRALVVQALERYEQLGDAAGRAQAEVVLGEIDYLLGDHARGARHAQEGRRAVHRGRRRAWGARSASSSWRSSRRPSAPSSAAASSSADARAEFDGIGYRLGHRAVRRRARPRRPPGLRLRRSSRAGARRPRQLPRGAEPARRGGLRAPARHGRARLATTATPPRPTPAWPSRSTSACRTPGGSSRRGCSSPRWRSARDDDRAEALVAACDARGARRGRAPAAPAPDARVARAAAGPVDRRGAAEIDAARAAFVVSSPEGGGVRAAEARARTGDHTPHLLTRLAPAGLGGPGARQDRGVAAADRGRRAPARRQLGLPGLCNAAAVCYTRRAMTTPQNPAVRRKQKARRSKQLAAWREKNADQEEPKAAPAGEPRRPDPRGRFVEPTSLQETYAPANQCFGCGPSNAQGLRIRSFAEGDDACVCRWTAAGPPPRVPGRAQRRHLRRPARLPLELDGRLAPDEEGRRRRAALHGHRRVRREAQAADPDGRRADHPRAASSSRGTTAPRWRRRSRQAAR